MGFDLQHSARCVQYANDAHIGTIRKLKLAASISEPTALRRSGRLKRFQIKYRRRSRQSLK
jgi:hypothetical protein